MARFEESPTHMSDGPGTLTPVNSNPNFGIGKSGVKIDKAHRNFPMGLSANPKAWVYDKDQFPVDYAAKCAFRNCEHVIICHLSTSEI
jgi:hypothetical protein